MAEAPETDLRTATAAEISRNFGMWQDRALTTPIIVTHHGRPRVVVVSAEAYKAMVGGDRLGGIESGYALETQLAAILEHTREGFVALDEQMHILAVNSVLEELVGQPASRMIGRMWGDPYPTPVSPVIGEELRRVIRTGEASEFETYSAKVRGRRYQVRAFPYPGGVAALFVNRTAQNVMREELQDSRAFTQARALLATSGQMKINIRGVIESLDEGFAAITGFVDADLTGSAQLTSIVRPQERRAVARVLETTLQSGEPATIEAILLVKGGKELAVRLAIAPILRDTTADGAAVIVAPRELDGLSSPWAT